MSTQNFSYLDAQVTPIPDATDMRIGIVVSEWNNHITDKLLEGAVQTLQEHGVGLPRITIKRVPGSFDLIYRAAQLAKHGHVNAVIAIGCVVRGDTPHFDYICEGVTRGLADLNANGSIPVIFGLITTNTQEQAEERAGGKLGNKGCEFAVTAIKMVDYAWQLQK